MRFVLAFLFSLVLIGCSDGGYEPTVKYSKTIFKEPVLVHVKIDPEDPDTGEYLQDEITKMAINRLNLRTTKDVNEAKNYILVNIYTINTTPTNKDDKGNVIRYSINAAIKFATQDKYGFWSKNIVASEYVPVKAKSSISESAKEKASRVAIKKALDEYVYAVIQRGQKMAKKHAKEDKQDNTPQNDSNTDTQNMQNSNIDTQSNSLGQENNDSSLSDNSDTLNSSSISDTNMEDSDALNIKVVDTQDESMKLVMPDTDTDENNISEVSGY